jgi:hypothetical protein
MLFYNREYDESNMSIQVVEPTVIPKKEVLDKNRTKTPNKMPNKTLSKNKKYDYSIRAYNGEMLNAETEQTLMKYLLTAQNIDYKIIFDVNNCCTKCSSKTIFKELSHQAWHAMMNRCLGNDEICNYYEKYRTKKERVSDNTVPIINDDLEDGEIREEEAEEKEREIEQLPITTEAEQEKIEENSDDEYYTENEFFQELKEKSNELKLEFEDKQRKLIIKKIKQIQNFKDPYAKTYISNIIDCVYEV